jgi:hypothetical protein
VAADEDEKLDILIELAYEMRSISKLTLQEFMLFSIDCARERLKPEYMQRKKQ